MRIGRVRLDYLAPGGSLTRVEGSLPLADGRVSLQPFGGPDEAGLRLEKAEPKLRLLGLRLELEEVNLRDRFFANGFQSWSQARLRGPDDRLGGLRLLGFLKPYGDYGWVDYPGRPGCFRSHWLTYTVDGMAATAAGEAGESAVAAAGASGGVTFLGSLNEATAYTVFYVDYRAGSGGRCWAQVDVEGLEPEPGDVLARIFWAEGDRAGSPGQESPLLPLVRRYADRQAEVWKNELPRGTLLPSLDHRPGGWNSWYNYYGKVTAKDILAEAGALKAAGLGLDFVQIDDGWQAEVGDWLEVSPRFAGKGPGQDPAGAAAPTRVLAVDELEPDFFRVRTGPGQPPEFLVNLADRPRRGVEAHGTVVSPVR